MLPQEYEGRLRELLNVFLAENQKLNLTALRTEKDCWIGNVLDALALLDLFSETLHPTTPRLRGAGRSIPTMLDIGTGGGFPLLPLAITMPESQFTGLDATKKKIDAVQRILEHIHCSNVRIICRRVEELAHEPDHRAQYDVVLARAVAPLNVLLEYSAPFAKKNGKLVFWKSMHIKEELEESLAARSILSCHLVHTHTYELPEGFGKRQLLLFEKMAETKEEYPRAIGMPSKKPLV